jgi:hypothetical protein
MGTTTGWAKEQRRTLAALTGTETADHFYLAGGSAVAFHLHHRQSNDLDLFSLRHEIDLNQVATALAAIGDLEVVSRTDAALKVRLGGTAIDIVRYAYPTARAAAIWS